MPQFKVIAKEVKKAGRKSAISQELIDSYKPFIEKLGRKEVGILEFGKNEKISIGRKALLAAAEELKKFIKVRKPRGTGNVLQFERITAAQAKNKAKGRSSKKAKEILSQKEIKDLLSVAKDVGAKPKKKGVRAKKPAKPLAKRKTSKKSS